MKSSRGALRATALLFASALLFGSGVNAEGPERNVFFVSLLADAGHGLSETETAAWIVRHPDGREALVPWPPVSQRKSHSWSGPVPGDAVALLHTHPATGNPRPSDRDRDVARRRRLPVYTISRWAIYRADPDGTVSPVQSPCWTPTIDWTLAEETLARPQAGALVADGSSGRMSPEDGAAVR